MKNPFFQKPYFKKNFIVATCGILAFLFSLSIYAENLASKDFAVINNKKVFLEVANTAEKRQLGLMYRDNLEENQGMIFLFDMPDYVNFWMKNVKIPLDILFIYKNKVVTMYSMVPACENDSCELYPSRYKIDYAIELKGGFCHKNKIKAGQTVKLSDELKRESDKFLKTQITR
ncbi:MAG: hypothetical protein A2104_02775 [Candidatus Melainabacteria bacterium GWF2_32_7]|nr:MAG: hypothetical protein A2104_02775 [Candidatus Melainabacteria bacterium GWF2_32_7]